MRVDLKSIVFLLTEKSSMRPGKESFKISDVSTFSETGTLKCRRK